MSYPTRERAAQVRLCVITFVTSLSHNIINGMMRWNRTYDESETHNDARGRSVWFELNRSPKTSGLSETSGLTWHGLRRGKRMQQQLAKRRRLSILFVIWKQSVGGLVAHGELCDKTGRNNDGQTIYRFMNTRVENNSWINSLFICCRLTETAREPIHQFTVQTNRAQYLNICITHRTRQAPCTNEDLSGTR